MTESSYRPAVKTYHLDRQFSIFSVQAVYDQSSQPRLPNPNENNNDASPYILSPVHSGDGMGSTYGSKMQVLRIEVSVLANMLPVIGARNGTSGTTRQQH